ncbi:hypothetical protein M9979_07850 [Sphingomonas sp. RP10(2022)]|uniref:EF-hand domain-containing protein n=1 Tax=Sphingomonas liriopis TaxID=2949094 RepID=A0A9X2HV69_9SPHN|nr:hypothetical protein [Sphingomonas liriopis]MCP3734781.1 hypothetical protein [Sphingomonas liriopis]
MHRITLLLAATLGCTFATAASAQQRRVFISPMGQPFHGSETAPDPERAWFAAADANGDGAITRGEFQADATRFFAILDRGHDGEIDPGDIDVYENTIAPETRSGDGGPGIIARSSDSSSDGGAKAPVYDAGKLGAARFSYFDLPEPVTAADRNFNRGIDPREFASAADSRFDALDKNRDGKLMWDELPHVSARAAGPGGRGKGGPGGHRGGRHGGGRGPGGGMDGGQGRMSGGFGGE